ncbi:MAG: pyridoxal phosphate-dependent aminotransferase [Candidatus Omnitrophica bacterium]|nr:pyridoxal phosphate-dependent aminotransferase [Candidatus Omnitrophota bacterium]
MELSRRIRGVSPSATLTITSKAKAMKKQGIDVVSFGAGEPDFDTPQYIKVAAAEAIEKGKTKYTPSIGTVELREAICEKLSDFNGLEYRPEDIVVSNGAKHTLYNIFQAICDEGDEVIVASPYWVSYTEMVKLSGARPVIVPTLPDEGFKMKPEDLSAALSKKTKAVIINSPSNPTGCVYSRDELKAISDIALKGNIRVIADEIYERLIYDGQEHFSFAALGQEVKDITILVNGVSKTYSMTGWRIGYLASSDREMTKSIKNLQDHSSSNPSSISQEAAMAALTKEDGSVEKMKKEFEARRDYMVERIAKIGQFSCVKPGGAFYCFVDVSQVNKDSLEFAGKLLDDAKVAVIPGEGFGTPGYIRLSFATSMENIEKGFDRIEEWLKQ